MVPETPFLSALSAPHGVVQELSASATSTNELARALQERYASLFPDAASRSSVQTLEAALESTSADTDGAAAATPVALRGRVVRWRCMVQDTGCGTEVLPRNVKLADGERRCALWQAEATAAGEVEELDASDLTERNVVYAVSIPGWSKWARAAWESGSDPADDGE